MPSRLLHSNIAYQVRYAENQDMIAMSPLYPLPDGLISNIAALRPGVRFIQIEEIIESHTYPTLGHHTEGDVVVTRSGPLHEWRFFVAYSEEEARQTKGRRQEIPAHDALRKEGVLIFTDEVAAAEQVQLARRAVRNARRGESI